MSKLVIVGTIAFDAIETPFGQTDKILGGAATYIGLAASHYSVDAALVSVVGGDFPQNHLDLLTDKGLNTRCRDQGRRQNLLLERALPQRYEHARHTRYRAQCFG